MANDTLDTLTEELRNHERKAHCSVAEAERWLIYQVRIAGVRRRRYARQTAKPAPLLAMKNDGYNGILKERQT